LDGTAGTHNVLGGEVVRAIVRERSAVFY
jgi:hypothetical protein